MLSGSQFTSVAVGGFNHVFLTGINNKGDVSGTAGNVFGASTQGFVIPNGKAATLYSYPGAASTAGGPINNLGQSVGQAFIAPQTLLTFIRNSDGTFSTVDLSPNCATSNTLSAINDWGEVVGSCLVANSFVYFYGAPGALTMFDEVPGSQGGTTSVMG